MVSAVSAATVSDFQPADHYGVILSLSPAATPPRGPGVRSMPPFIVSHPAFKLQQRRQQQATTEALRAGVILLEYGDQSTYYFHHLHRQRQQTTGISHLQERQDSPLADLCTAAGIQQASSIISSFFSADSASGMFRQLPTDMSAQPTLMSSLDMQLPAEAQQACKGTKEGVTLEEFSSQGLSSWKQTWLRWLAI